MAEPNTATLTAERGFDAIEVSSVLRNTYILLAMTLAFSVVTCAVSVAVGAPYMGLWTLLPYFAFLWLCHKFQNSAMGIVWVFALTGWLGFTIGPLVSIVATVNPSALFMALGSTAAVFFATSGYILVTKKDMSFMTGFIMTGILIAFIAGIASFFIAIPGLSLAVAAMFAFLSSLLIMWQTSAIIHGGERNYLMATITLYVSIYNLFTSLLSLFMAFDE